MVCEAESRCLGGMYAFLPKGTWWELLEDHNHYSTLKRDPTLFFFFLCVFLWEGILPGNLESDLLFIHFPVRHLLGFGALGEGHAMSNIESLLSHPAPGELAQLVSWRF